MVDATLPSECLSSSERVGKHIHVGPEKRIEYRKCDGGNLPCSLSHSPFEHEAISTEPKRMLSTNIITNSGNTHASALGQTTEMCNSWLLPVAINGVDLRRTCVNKPILILSLPCGLCWGAAQTLQKEFFTVVDRVGPQPPAAIVRTGDVAAWSTCEVIKAVHQAAL